MLCTTRLWGISVDEIEPLYYITAYEYAKEELTMVTSFWNEQHPTWACCRKVPNKWSIAIGLVDTVSVQKSLHESGSFLELVMNSS